MSPLGPSQVVKLRVLGDIEGLIQALGPGEYATVRRVAAEALGQIGDPRAVEPLTNVLKDENEQVRRVAAEALGQIGDPRAVEPLITVLKDRKMSSAAAQALGQIGDPRAVEPLISIIADLRFATDYEVALGMADYAAAVEALTTIGEAGPGLIESLATKLKNPREDVRKISAEALDRFGWQPTNDETGAWYWATKGELTKCCEIGTRAVESLITVLKGGKMSSAAAQALGQIGDPRAVEPLIASFEDYYSSWSDMAVVAEALAQIGDPRAVEPLCSALVEPSGHLRVAIANALGKIGDPGAVEGLIRLLKGEMGVSGPWMEVHTEETRRRTFDELDVWDKDVRKAAAEALGMIGDSRAIRPLKEFLNDRDEELRQVATYALEELYKAHPEL